MGAPMARNLALADIPLMVWNRSTPATDWFRDNGVPVARTLTEIFDACGVIILMLANSDAIDEVLRPDLNLAERVRGRTVVNMGTVSPETSLKLAGDVAAAGGHFVECPVSGSRTPAEQGTLVAMLAGEHNDVEKVQQLIRPMCSRSFVCGVVPDALVTKLAVNHFLITMVTGLVEAAHFAQSKQLDMQQFGEIIGAGPMASQVATGKLAKMAAGDMSAQASLRDVLMNIELIRDATTRAKVASPLLDTCLYLFREADGLGVGGSDMIAVLASLEMLTATTQSHESGL